MGILPFVTALLDCPHCLPVHLIHCSCILHLQEEGSMPARAEGCKQSLHTLYNLCRWPPTAGKVVALLRLRRFEQTGLGLAAVPWDADVWKRRIDCFCESRSNILRTLMMLWTVRVAVLLPNCNIGGVCSALLL